METMYQILGLIGAGLILFYIYTTIKGRPELFSKQNLNKSFFIMGVLAIGLIGFVALLIIVVRSS